MGRLQNVFVALVATVVAFICYIMMPTSPVSSLNLTKKEIGLTRMTLPEEDVDHLGNFKQINSQLIKSINQKCLTDKNAIVGSYIDHTKLRAPILDWVWTVFPTLDLFYCAVPKCASTTWKAYLIEATGSKWASHEDLAFNPKMRKLFNAMDVIKNSQHDPLFWISNSIYKNRFMIVRNPWHRLVSAYRNKIVFSKWNLQSFCPGYGKAANLTPGKTTFEQFVDCVLQRKPGGFVNGHTHPISDMCAVCYTNYSLILRAEDIPHNTPFVQSILNLNSTQLDPSHHARETSRPKNSSTTNNYIADYYKQLDSVTLDKIREEYKYDFILFDYPVSPF